MLVSLMAGIAAAGFPIEDQLRKAPIEHSTVCGAGGRRDLVQIRVFPINRQQRIFPSPKEIIEKGGRSAMVRAFWQEAMGAICDQNMPDADDSAYEFLPRIVVFVEGEEDREPLLLEYPDWSDSPAPVRGRVNGRMVAVPAAFVRRLLDYSREGWRD
jgi:hypothetical protein